MNQKPTRILVVDDEFGMREGCRRVLSAEGYEVQTAEDGMAGLEAFKTQGDFAAALIDLKMPRMSGIELIEQIRKQDQDIVLLVITAYATIETAVEATKKGAYSYIPKPFTPDELLLPVRNGLERRALALEAKRLREERERRLLEAAFERSQSSTVINCMTDGVVVINRDVQIVLRNAAAARLLPELASLPIPTPLSALSCTDLRSLLQEEVLKAVSKPMILSKEISIERGTYMVNASPVMDPNGEVLGAVAVLRDITALKKLETTKSTFVSMVAHEIKSPLAAIEGYLNLVLSGAAGDGPEQDRDMMQKAMVRAQTLRTMVSELIDIVAVETGNLVLKRSPVAIGDLVADVVEASREKAAQKKIELGLDCEEAARGQKVLADRRAVLSVLGNLIDNAIKYGVDGGHVNVRMGKDGIYVRVAVRDDGIGMTAQEKERAFDEFYRARNKETADIPGTGLGLSLAKRLVELHQGKITVDSAPGQGSTFVVSLPVAEQGPVMKPIVTKDEDT
jgi:signal transduction histidine kinase